MSRNKATRLTQSVVNEVKSRTAQNNGGKVAAGSGAAVLDSIYQKGQAQQPTPKAKP